MTRIIAVSNLFPNRRNPQLGTFNLQEFSALSRLADVKVISPLPIGKFRGVPKRDIIRGLETFYPRYLWTPKIGRSLYALWLIPPLWRTIKRIIGGGFDPDLLLVAWCDPDGVAALMVSRILDKPCVIKALGTDINLFTENRLRRRSIGWALRKADVVIAVSHDLKRKIMALGVNEEKIEVHYNGVDTDLFRPMDRSVAITKLIERGFPDRIFDGRLILFVGNFYPIKGARILMEALSILSKSKRLPNLKLILIGDGPERRELQELSCKLRLRERVWFIGRRPHEEIPLWMNAADLLCLPSLNEGLPNVILEAHACGRPVVASDVGGVREILVDGEGGYLCRPADPKSLAMAVLKSLRPWNKAKIRAKVEGLSWDENARRILLLARSLRR
ncbi:glycosyltransferase family 4 protein [Candidatus Poribacteria bacterium]|nr:glycosyltransferase family 4 protein [Candidatus Poribacteria bacterium]